MPVCKNRLFFACFPVYSERMLNGKINLNYKHCIYNCAFQFLLIFALSLFFIGVVAIFHFDESEHKTQNILTYAAVLTAIFSPLLSSSYKKHKRIKNIAVLFAETLGQLKGYWENILNKQKNMPSHNNTKEISISETRFGEIIGYEYLLADILIKESDIIELSHYPKTLCALNTYQKNLSVLKTRDKKFLTKDTIDLQIKLLGDAIKEWPERDNSKE